MIYPLIVLVFFFFFFFLNITLDAFIFLSQYYLNNKIKSPEFIYLHRTNTRHVFTYIPVICVHVHVTVNTDDTACKIAVSIHRLVIMSIDLSKKFTPHVQMVTGSADVIVTHCYVTTCRCCIVYNHLIVFMYLLIKLTVYETKQFISNKRTKLIAGSPPPMAILALSQPSPYWLFSKYWFSSK